MSFESIRPIISGIIGALVAHWLCSKWARWIPRTVGTTNRETLLKKHKATIGLGNILSFVGLISPLALISSGTLLDNDWRGLGLGAGLMVLLPLVCVAVANARHGIEAIKECLVAYAISQRTPPTLFFVLTALLMTAGIASVIGFLI